jgi:osmotically-inducible protein OsmY
MSIARLTGDDLHLRNEALQRLERDPDVDASAIGVAARDGVVALTGFIDSCAGKLAAERAVKLARGVRAVANDLQVRLDRTDADIAQDAARALDECVTVPTTVQAVVHNGHVTLTGTVSWLCQRSAAENAVRHVHGTWSIVNRIRIVPPREGRTHRVVMIRGLNDRVEIPVPCTPSC